MLYPVFSACSAALASAYSAFVVPSAVRSLDLLQKPRCFGQWNRCIVRHRGCAQAGVIPGADHALDHRTRTKMQDEAHCKVGCFQIVQDLRLSNRVEYQPGLRLDDHRLLDYQVRFIDTDRDSAVDQVIPNKLLDCDAAASKFDGESFPIGGLQKAVPKCVVDVNERFDDLPREVLYRIIRFRKAMAGRP
jgi:hypothetical protein